MMNGTTAQDGNFSLQDLAARAEIADLVARYSRAVDRRDFALLASLYASGAVQDHGAAFCGEAPQFVQWLKDSMGTMVTQHVVGNMILRVFGDEAEGEVYTVNYHIIDGAAPIQFIGGGRYLDRYRKHEGRWLFAHRRRVIDWSREEPAQPSPNTASSARGLPGPDDLSYAHLSRLAGVLAR